MGGGAAMRSAAAKVVGIGGVLRRAPAPPAAPQSVRSASRSGGVPAIASAKGGEVAPGDVPQAAAQMPAWEVDDWDLAAFEEGPAGEPMARVVFGGVPSYDEAKAATAELKDAIDKVYLSSTSTAGCEDQLPADQASGLPLLANSVETQSLVIGDALAAYPAPKHAVQAFTLLSQSPVAQSVVASLASDPNFWSAAMQNDAVKDFLQSQNSSIQLPYMETKVEESGDDALSDDWKSPRKVEEISEGGHDNGLMTILRNIKLSVEEMVSNIPSFLANIFSLPSAEKTSTNEGNAGPAFNEKAFGVSFMGLALLAIIIVLLRRG
ncbi:uncharacterized protein LOC115727548 isoform X2 [Rhodamnia argentea]|uniref:Uncharacterized protein LOC115727548 isoform X2 n=1 Tax=Rhodamnia argentea TaxID=178133 RepID=A0A8B8MU78_9MYRT|nr:uncharacterized protein LOC115727548 isoform X2 [Rhodamnia argentea]